MGWNPITFFFGKDKTPTQSVGVQYDSPTNSNATFNSAMQLSAVFACTRIITESVGAMPLDFYEIEAQSGLKKKTKHPIHDLLQYKPNRYQNRIQFFEQLVLNLVCSGNAYIKIDRDSRGNIYSLLPLNSSQITVNMTDSGDIEYVHKKDDQTFTYRADQISHIRLFGNGLIGLSPLGHASNQITTASNIDQRVSKIAANGGKLSGILSVDTPQPLKPEQREALKKSLETHAKSDGIMVLEQQMRFNGVSLSPSDLQLLENRKFGIEEIARIFGVPSALINDSSNSKWALAETRDLFFRNCIHTYLERIEMSLKTDLLPRSEWSRYEFEFNYDRFLRLDLKTRTEAYATAINSGQLTPNEARAREGMSAQEGGDKLFVNGALLPVTDDRTAKHTTSPNQKDLNNEKNSD